MTQPPDPQFPGPQPDPAQGPNHGEQAFPPPQPQQQPPGQPYGEQPAPEPKKKSSLGKRLASLVVVLAIAGFGIWQSIQAKSGLKVDNCLVLSGDSANNVDHKEVDCGDTTQFSMKVVSVSGSSGECDPEGIEYSVTTRRGGATVACMMPNFQLGQCYTETKDNSMFAVAECDAADFKVAKIEDDTRFQCAAEEMPWAFSNPPKTFCLADPAS